MAIVTATDKLKQLFSDDWLNRIAKKHKLVIRMRDITPLRLVSAVVVALGDGSAASIADILRAFNGITSDPADRVEYKPFHNKLRQQGFANLMQAVAQRAMVVFRDGINKQVPEKLKRFTDVLIQDGSSFAVHDDLAEYFPGRFTKVSPAAVELHMTMSLLDHQPVNMTLTADKESERACLPEPVTLANKLLLADAGYVGSAYMKEVDQHQGNFLMRNSNALNPEICGAFNTKGKELTKLIGLRLKQQRHGHSRYRVLDLDVRWKGFRCRAVRYWDCVEKRYLTWLTNLSRDEFSADEIMKIYRLRWQVELLFKDLKSHNNLHRFVTRQPHMVTGLVWASVLSQLVKSYLGKMAQLKTGRLRISPLKTAASAGEWLRPVMKSLATRFTTQLLADVGWALDYIAANCIRAPQSKSRKDNGLYEIYEALNA